MTIGETPSAGAPAGAGRPDGAPLDGVVVVDLGRYIAGPYCSFVLASLGATVVRVEPLGGDTSWRVPPFLGPGGTRSTANRGPDEISLIQLKRGRGKRSVALDYTVASGHAALLRLVARSDVVVENFRPASLEPLGLDPATLLGANPRLVYCAISGFGLSGPNRDWPSMDIAIQAASGFMGRSGFPDGPPVKCGVTIGDQVPGAYAALGVVSALRLRDRTGEGQVVDVAMSDVLTSLVWDDPVDWYASVGIGERWGNSDPRGGPLNVYRAADGWVGLTIGSDGHWASACRLMGRDDLVAVGRTLADRQRNMSRCDGALAAWCAAGAAEERAEALRAAGIPAARVASALEAPGDPQVADRGTLRPVVHPASPDIDTGFVGPAVPLRVGRHRPGYEPAETLGASTRELLASLGGLSKAELDELAAAGAI